MQLGKKNYIPALNHGSRVTSLTSIYGLLTSSILHHSMNQFWLGLSSRRNPKILTQ